MDLVRYDQNMLRRHLIKLCRRRHGLAGVVHKRLRLHEQDLLPAELRLCRERVKAQPVDVHAAVLFHDVRREEARVVPRVLILQPRVAEKHDQPLHAAMIGKKHHSNSEEMLISS